ncbi:MAG: alpha-L-fucosidase [Verrucomicrobia bacterium]|nr:alpha-L-fucosidase [Verrucomicrobiota bacterium]MCH8510747.1 alpha-L-fucosidase [Kiritimatiellia bacterium]
MPYDPFADAQLMDRVKRGEEKADVRPSPEQRAWMELKFGLFVHFGINTFHDTEWSDGSLPADSFDPAELNTDAWADAAVSAGMKYLVLTTKHHDGFCLWPSDWTDYTVAHTPGKVDVVERLADSCRRKGLKLGFYYSLWDRHEPSFEHDHGYALFMKRQLTELLTRYGEVVQLWFDGGWKKGGVHYQDPERWYWREVYEHIKCIQPNCLVGNNGTSSRKGEIVLWPCDYRMGEKGLPTEKDRTIWYCGGVGDYLPYESSYTLSKGGDGQGAFASGKWFWHESDVTVQSPEWVLETLAACRERGANLLLNAGPMASGRMRPMDVQTLAEVGKGVRARNLLARSGQTDGDTQIAIDA